MKKLFSYNFILLYILFLSSSFLGKAQLVITNQGAPAATIVSGFIGTGLTITNPVISCPSVAYGTFSGGTGIGVTNGVALTTGTSSQLTNAATYFMSTNNGTTCADAQLTSLDASAVNDCCILEFDVVPSCDLLTVRFVFGSEEYPTFVNSSFNDAFGFFVTGPNPGGGNYTNKNIAIVTGTTICSIDNVNAGTNSSFYVNNSGGTSLPFGGYTTAITSSLSVTPCQSYHFKMAIADAGDHIYDSGVLIDFLQCSTILTASTTSTPTTCGANNGTATVTTTNGIGTMSYNWSPAPGGGQGTATATGLTGGVAYTVTVDDIYSCIAPVTSSVTIAGSTGAPNVTNAPLVQTICSGTSTALVNLTADVVGTTFAWTATASAGISGFTASGTSTIPVQTLTNSSATSGTVTYAITPSAGGCTGPVVNYVITVDPEITPTFAAVANVCQNDPAPVLPTSSTNVPAITGTWSPAVSTATAGTTTYTFTPGAGQCATTATNTITVDALITPTFAAVANVCQNDPAPVLPTSSTNAPAITGTWTPAVSTATAGTTTYTFTPGAGQCATTVTNTISVDAPVTPTFTAIPNVCQNDPAPVLATSSNDSPAITGTWSPAVSTASLGTTTYTFTPDAGQCATTTTGTITVSTPVTPTFAAIPNACQNTAAPVLPTNSTDTPAIPGTWSPAVSTSTVGTTTYTFTPDAGVCAVTTTNTITVDAPVTPTFNAVPNVCQNDPAPTLPTSSTNVPAITGTWSPVVSTATAGTITYTFTSAAGQCATTSTTTITVDGPVTPTFTAVPNVCQNSAAPTLPANSTDVPTIAGSWSPAVSTATAGTTTYTFTPTAGQCATTTTTTITVDPEITPTFTAIPNVCQNDPAPTLPGSSNETPAITGTWSPAVSTASLGTTTYTFTPTAGQCAVSTTMDIIVSTPVTPLFAAIPSVCQNAAAPVLPTNSTNVPAIPGTWSPAVSTATAGTTTYTFTPSAGVCAVTATNTITVDAPVTTTFNAVPNVCQNDAAPVLPTNSTNTPAITGTWSPAVSTATAGTTTYMFTPGAGQCATTATSTITVDAPAVPTFAVVPNVCQNSASPVLPGSSTNTPAITGAWSPAVSTVTAGTTTYTFTPTAGQCATTGTTSITVDPQITPTFAAIPNVCQNSSAPILPTNSTNVPAISGTWTPSVSTALAGTTTYTFNPSAGQCAVTATNTVTVDPQITPLFTPVNPICFGSVSPVLPTISNNTPPISGTWSPMPVDNTVNGTYTFTPGAGQCATTTTLSVTVNPLAVLIVNDPAPVCSPATVDLTDSLITLGSSGGTISYFSNPSCTSPLLSATSIGASGTFFIKSVTPQGCNIVSPVIVVINSLPTAYFEPSVDTLDAYNLVSIMENGSSGADSYEWVFEDGATSSDVSPEHTFPDSLYGDQFIVLIATSPEGCKDTTMKIVTIVEELIFYVPNAFTPDGDKFNQTFQPVFTSGYDPSDFTMLIFDRWGEIIFETHDASIGWNGRFGVDGELVQDGVLTWKIEFKLNKNDKRILKTGHVNVLR